MQVGQPTVPPYSRSAWAANLDCQVPHPPCQVSVTGACPQKNSVRKAPARSKIQWMSASWTLI